MVRTRIYVTDISKWKEVGEAHGEVFATIRPATTMVEVARLIDDAALVEIEADALVWPELGSARSDIRPVKAGDIPQDLRFGQVEDISRDGTFSSRAPRGAGPGGMAVFGAPFATTARTCSGWSPCFHAASGQVA